jgi:acyl carrier protein
LFLLQISSFFYTTSATMATTNQDILRLQMKELIVRALQLDGRHPSSIDDDAPLFGEGLGLDSLDALQLAMSIEDEFKVRVPDGAESRKIFASVAALAQFVGDQQK